MSDDTEKILDETLLRHIARRLGTLSLVESVSVFPHERPESVVAWLDLQYFPDTIQQVVFEIRVYTNGDFNITYREERDGTAWMCRWDRHENPHNSRDHFHQPPKARTEDAVDRDFPADFVAVIDSVLEHVDDRVGEVWNNHE
ncbi:hypothetical protein [Haladaptatus caseinilyticus]|uniref:hypothetical protein n=1 Tax=Haladaptatus caseinilyticus TaxID=2993314 RepID=UPI00224AA37E|nr:hypothetical protein [Haladaptatus caseinilyticus]